VVVVAAVVVDDDMAAAAAVVDVVVVDRLHHRPELLRDRLRMASYVTVHLGCGPG
jgi:hypothetical protein